jgi:16S rRNA pseudouridine516 synthase
VLKEIKPYLSPKDLAYAERRPDFPATLVKLTITEGKKHQVKRMMLYMGNRVLYLKRLSFANIELDENLGLGQYRELTEEEIDALVNIKNN